MGFNADTRKVFKCDFGDRDSRCTRFCEVGAIQYVNAEAARPAPVLHRFPFIVPVRDGEECLLLPTGGARRAVWLLTSVPPLRKECLIAAGIGHSLAQQVETTGTR